MFRIQSLNLLSIEWIHCAFSMNSLGVSLIFYEFPIFFLEFNMNLLYLSRIYYEFTFFHEFIMLPFSVYRGSSKNSFSASRIHHTPHSLSIAVSVRIHLRLREFVSYFEKILWIKYLFYNEICLFRESTMYLLSISRIHCFLSDCMHSFYMFHPDQMSFSTYVRIT